MPLPTESFRPIMTSNDFLVSLFSRMDLDTVAHFMEDPRQSENPPPLLPESSMDAKQVDFYQDLLRYPDSFADQEAFVTRFGISWSKRDKQQLHMAPKQSKEEAVWINHGGIRAVSKLWRDVWDRCAPKKFTIETFRAYNKNSLSLMENVVFIELPSYEDPGLLYPNTLKFMASLHLLKPSQLRSLSVLRLNPYSIYDLMMKSYFMRVTIPGLDVLAAEERRPPFSLDVFSAGFTIVTSGQFGSPKILTRLVTASVSEREPEDNIIIGLIGRCRTLELNWAFNPFNVVCVMKLAYSAEIIRFNNTPSGLGYVSNETEDKIREVFGNCLGGVEEDCGVSLFSNFKRLEFYHYDPKGMAMGLLKALCTGDLLGRLPLLSEVREVCISGAPSMNYPNCMKMSSVRKLEFRNLSVLMLPEPDVDADFPPVDLDRALQPDLFLRKTGVKVAQIACRCFPNIEALSVSLKPDEEAEVLERYTGRDLFFLEAILGELHSFTQCRDRLELRLCKGLVAMAGLSTLRDDMEVYERNGGCFVVGKYQGGDGEFVLQLTLDGPCCTQSKVVCKCETETGVTERLYLRCKVCSLKYEPEWDLGYYDQAAED